MQKQIGDVNITCGTFRNFSESFKRVDRNILMQQLNQLRIRNTVNLSHLTLKT